MGRMTDIPLEEKQAAMRERSYIAKREVKLRFSDILRDPATPAAEWVETYWKAKPLFPEWNRRPRKPRQERTVDEIVQEMEAGKAFKNDKGDKPI